MKLNFDDQSELKNQINELQPTKGVCIFIDICGSTALKRKDLKEWVLLIGNTIRFCTSVSKLFKDNVLKLIGDEIMIFIPDDKINVANENYETILGLLKICLSFERVPFEKFILRSKAAIHYCTNSYNFSYDDYSNDFYGNDIDLTARLMTKSVENKIVLSETYYQKVISNNASYFEDIPEILTEEFKGFIEITNFRIIES